MSKIGKQPIDIPQGVKVSIKDRTITVEGPKGKLNFDFSSLVNVEVSDSKIVVKPLSQEKLGKALFGTTRAVINNMVKGVTEGFKKELEIVGVGYKAQMKGKTLALQIGFSHPVEISVPEGINVSVPSATKVTIEGIDKIKVGQFAANIRKIYPPEPYKGKGIRYSNEVVRKKLGKAMAK